MTQEMAETVAAGLRQARMAVDVALDGPAGLERALVNGYDVIVLDRDLPGMHGDEVCGRLVDSRVPQPGADAHRRGRDRGPGGGAGPGRR